MFVAAGSRQRRCGRRTVTRFSQASRAATDTRDNQHQRRPCTCTMKATVLLLCSVFASAVSASDCGQEELMRCLQSFNILETKELGFGASKAELHEMCSPLQKSLECVDNYTIHCMTDLQRNHFTHLYSGTTAVIRDICQEGDYREEYLHHAGCMSAVTAYENCLTKYQQALGDKVPSVEPSSDVDSESHLKTICCSFQDYVYCSTNVVEDHCGKQTANFTKHFLGRMSRPLFQGHCDRFSSDCMSSGSSLAASATLLVLMASVLFA